MFGNLSPKTTSNEPNETSTIENENSDLNQDDGASHVPAASGAATLLPHPVDVALPSLRIVLWRRRVGWSTIYHADRAGAESGCD